MLLMACVRIITIFFNFSDEEYVYFIFMGNLFVSQQFLVNQFIDLQGRSLNDHLFHLEFHLF